MQKETVIFGVKIGVAAIMVVKYVADIAIMVMEKKA